MTPTESPIRVFEMFAGYGGASFALKKAQIPHAVVGFSEIDKYAIQCYQQNHYWKTDKSELKISAHNFGDATKIKAADLPDFDLLTGGFPCQAFSVAGKGLGELDTRGTLFNEIIRIAEVKKPRWMLLENVKGLTTKPHKATFDKILSELKRIGYTVQWKVLNSKKFGTPQNRERVFFVCFRNKEDADKFTFPQEQQLTKFIKNILEPEVDKKYYLSEQACNRLLKKSRNNVTGKDVSGAILATNYKCNWNSQIIQLNDPIHSNDRVYSSNGVSPTLNTMQGGNRQPFIVASRGRNPHNPSDRTIGAPTEQRLEPNTEGTSNSLTSVQKDNLVFNGKLRKLTPKECFRLMGFFNDEINLEGISNSQRYKLAGNGWDINLVSQIMTEIFK